MKSNKKISKDPDVYIVSFIYDKTSSFGKGSDKGPEAILKNLNTQIEVYERFTKTSPSEILNISDTHRYDFSDMQPENMVSTVSSTIRTLKKNNKFIISLGGEHSITTGIFDAWKGQIKDTTILQIDAHLDLRDSDEDYNKESPSRYAHSCVMKRALDMGFKIVPVGIRAYADFELEVAKKNKIKIFEWPIIENKQLINNILKQIKTKNVYITLDVDGIDPSHMPGTGTPVQGGLSWQFTFDLLAAVFKKKNVVGLDLVEVAPTPNSTLTEYGAAQLIYYMIALKFKK